MSPRAKKCIILHVVLAMNRVTVRSERLFECCRIPGALNDIGEGIILRRRQRDHTTMPKHRPDNNFIKVDLISNRLTIYNNCSRAWCAVEIETEV